MAVKSRHQLAKDAAKARSAKREAFFQKQKVYAKLDELSKLELYAGGLISQIKNCQADLQGMFKNNEVIQRKQGHLEADLKKTNLQIAKLRIEKEQQELEQRQQKEEIVNNA